MADKMSYQVEIDIDYNRMAQDCELDERSGRYVFEHGWEYTPDARIDFWPQWGTFWTRDEHGQAWVIYNNDIAF